MPLFSEISLRRSKRAEKSRHRQEKREPQPARSNNYRPIMSDKEKTRPREDTESLNRRYLDTKERRCSVLSLKRVAETAEESAPGTLVATGRILA